MQLYLFTLFEIHVFDTIHVYEPQFLMHIYIYKARTSKQCEISI